MNDHKFLRRLIAPLPICGLMLLAILGMVAYTIRDAAGFYLKRSLARESEWFEASASLPRAAHQLFDIGVVDADKDGYLDIFTSNHNYRQLLLLSDRRGDYEDILTSWGLDQDRDFPGWEQSMVVPDTQQPGLYIYWLGDNLTLRAFGLSELGPVSGKLAMLSEIAVLKSWGFVVRQTKAKGLGSAFAESLVEFSATNDGVLELLPPSRGMPTTIELEKSFPLSKVFVGNQRVNPAGHLFTPYLRDRHGLAWADINADGQLDIYISRGGSGGTLRELPDSIRSAIRDELLLTGGASRFREVGADYGIEKKDCSGRHVEWVDAIGDGQLELFVNCQDRGKSGGVFPKQLWTRGKDGHFHDVAMEVGLGLPGHEFIDFAWMDADLDGDLDLLTNENEGFFLYRGDKNKFSQEFVFRPNFVRADVSALKGEVNNYWRFDGKMSVADFDSDGDADAFIASKRGNEMLVNESGTFMHASTRGMGLPGDSVNATWVDYDNDGMLDLHVVPDGLFRQVRKGQFEPTSMLGVMPHRYQAAIINWYDSDNDGDRDALVALNENPTLRRWWQIPFKSPGDAFSWELYSWHSNAGHGNHWLQIEVEGPEANPQAIGARVTVFATGSTQAQEVGFSDSSFFSQGHYRLYFGLGQSRQALRIEVRWTDGEIRKFSNVEGDRLLHISQASLGDL